MEILIVSCSLNPASRSRRLAAAAARVLEQREVGTQMIDLKDYDLPMCDGAEAYSHPGVQTLAQVISRASAVLLAVPIYNYDTNAAAKNLIELTGRAWQDKPVGFLCAAGGRSAYMGVMGLANSLMLDFRCSILPRFVYASADDFDSKETVSAGVHERVTEIAESIVRLAEAVGAPGVPTAAGGNST